MPAPPTHCKTDFLASWAYPQNNNPEPSIRLLINVMDTETTKENFQEVLEFVEELKSTTQGANDSNSQHLPQESEAHQELRNEVKPLLDKIHKDYNRLFCEAYEEHDLTKAQKLRKLLTEMLVLIRSSD